MRYVELRSEYSEVLRILAVGTGCFSAALFEVATDPENRLACHAKIQSLALLYAVIHMRLWWALTPDRVLP